MKIALPLSLVASATAFSTTRRSSAAVVVVPSTTCSRKSFLVVPKSGNTALFMSESENMTEEEEVELLTKKEVEKTKRISNLRNANGVDYAPWMKMTEEDESLIRQQIKEKTAVRRKRQIENAEVKGNLAADSQYQELSGTGLSFKVIGTEVELEWATTTEKDTAGFRVNRRPAKTEDWSTIASFEDWGPLASQGPNGGVYRYLDSSTSPGGYVYRITEVDSNGADNDLCQCLVEVQTEEEQRAAVIAGVGIAVVGLAAVIGASVLDPMNGY